MTEDIKNKVRRDIIMSGLDELYTLMYDFNTETIINCCMISILYYNSSFPDISAIKKEAEKLSKEFVKNVKLTDNISLQARKIEDLVDRYMYFFEVADKFYTNYTRLITMESDFEKT